MPDRASPLDEQRCSVLHAAGAVRPMPAARCLRAGDQPGRQRPARR